MKDFILTHQALFYGFATAGTLASAVVSVGLAGIRIRLVSLSRRDVEEAVASVTAEKGHILLFALLQTLSIQNAILVLDSLVFVEKFRRRARSSLSPDAEFRYFAEISKFLYHKEKRSLADIPSKETYTALF